MPAPAEPDDSPGVPAVDFQAVARVSRNVELAEIRLIEMTARLVGPGGGGQLRPVVNHECSAATPTENTLDVTCRYRFSASSAETEIATATLVYVLRYRIEAQPLDEGDVAQFAYANGTYHSWPFVRQMLFDLTSRMGFPPYTLHTFKFNPKPPSLKPAAAETDASGTPEKKPPRSPRQGS